MLNNKKRSQSTLFIIIGIISLIVIITLYIFFKKDITALVSGSGDEAINSIVQECVKEVGYNGIKMLELQGGFLNVNNYNPYSILDIGIKIPIWDKYNYPTYDSMKKELNEYVKTNSLGCINSNIKGLDDIYNFTIIEDEFNVKTNINDNSVDFEIKLPIRYKKINSNENEYVDDFYVKLNNIKLKQMYDLAIAIYNEEIKTEFLERLVMEQIMNDNNYKDKESMPSEGMFFSCAKRVWTYPQLQRNLINLNNNNFKYLKFKGTKELPVPNEHTIYYKNKDYYNSIYSINPENLPKDAKDFIVKTSVPYNTNYGNYLKSNVFLFKKFEITPSEGGLVTSMDIDVSKMLKLPFHFKIPLPCIQVFHHLYTLDYPILFQITDSKTGQIFQFPLRIKINRNIPNSNGLVPIINEKETNLLNYKLRFCSEKPIKGTYNYTIDGKTIQEDYEIPPIKRYPLKIIAKDKETGKALRNVNITQECVGISCNIGKTDYPKFRGIVRTLADPELYANFSYCINSKIIAKKSGYYAEPLWIDIDDSILRKINTPIYVIEMIKLIELKPSVIALVNANNPQLTLRSVKNNKGDFVYITLEANQYDYSTSVIISYENEFNEIPEMRNLKLLNEPDVTYNLTAYYIDKDYNLLGIKIKNNWKPNTLNGEFYRMTILGYNTQIKPENYVNYYDIIKNNDDYSLEIY